MSLNIQITSGGIAAPACVLSPVALDERGMLAEAGFDPDMHIIDGAVATTVNARGFTYRFKAVRVVHDLPALHATASRRRNAPYKVQPVTGLGEVVVYADAQWGKTASGGGSPETIERSARVRGHIVQRLRRKAPAEIALVDLGDGIESFNNVASQAFTNDLSLPQQIDAYATDVFLWVEALARIAPVTVTVVPSNHSAWREGKQTLGRPEDDFGIMVHRLVERQARAARLDATWVYPQPFDETVTVTVVGHIIGAAHGHQAAPQGLVKWWTGQTFGRQAIADAEVLLTGHYHHLALQAVGERRWWVQAPTLDGGSDWYRAKSGLDTPPGVLTFSVRRDTGFDVGSLDLHN
ncbi:hypothetical protein [Microbacterium sp. Leaf203]|uniref:hypothetical protein n=1 Tax=Microbacterium sp. Leaf203 TaxID=1735677 RepID=UPI000A4FAC2C|nr:hypothetical protein [Microbacterium sp. Leaf203]